MNDPKVHEDKTGLRLEELIQMALRIGSGVADVEAISPSDISVEAHLADLCREPKCGYYGLSANCPPYVSGPAEFRDLLQNCKHVLAIKIDFPEGFLFTELNDILKLMHEIVADIEKSAIKLGYSNSRAFAVGTCKAIFCDEHERCSAIDGGKCRYPQYARPAIEAYGVNVHELNKAAGWLVNRDTKVESNQESTGALYGLVLIGK